MKVVIDTNSLLVSIGRKSRYRPIFDALIAGEIQMLISNDIVSEYTEKLEERTSKVVARNVMDFLIRSPDVVQVEIYFKWSVIVSDADDNKFVDCALNGNADFLVTDDKHFNILKKTAFPTVKLLKTRAFLEKL